MAMKARIALLAWSLRLAVGVEAADGGPGAVGSLLPGLGVERGDEGETPRQYGTVPLEVVGGDVVSIAPIHPEAQTGIADELDGADGLVHGSPLRWASPQLILQREHGSAPPWLLASSLPEVGAAGKPDNDGQRRTT